MIQEPAAVPQPLLARLQDALAHGGDTHSLDDVLRAVGENKAQLWMRDGAVLVTEVNVAPRGVELHIWLAGGELQAVLALADDAMEWGRAHGCTVATMTGRRGWEKVLTARGWGRRLITMARAI